MNISNKQTKLTNLLVTEFINVLKEARGLLYFSLFQESFVDIGNLLRGAKSPRAEEEN